MLCSHVLFTHAQRAKGLGGSRTRGGVGSVSHILAQYPNYVHKCTVEPRWDPVVGLLSLKFNDRDEANWASPRWAPKVDVLKSA
jgi:hypothetical protein